MMIKDISDRLHEINISPAICREEGFSFGCAYLFAKFYKDFNDTNIIVSEAERELTSGNADDLFANSLSLLSETEVFLATDRSELQTVDFERIFTEHLKPFEQRYEDAKKEATRLWREYSEKNNRFDFLPLDADEYKNVEAECNVLKNEYDNAHARVNLLYNQWKQEEERCFCVYCFKPLFLDVLVNRLKGISESVITDIKRMKEGET